MIPEGNFRLLLVLAVVWEITWKGIALWRAAKNNHRNWFIAKQEGLSFIALLIINTVGVLPILYLKFFQRR